MVRILHVTECYAGGVRDAIEMIADLTPENEHYLLYSGSDLSVNQSKRYVETVKLSSNKAIALLKIKSLVRKVDPDYVHAHSSWAGLYTRARKIEVPVIYQPHCFKFGEATRIQLISFLVKAIETLLAPRTLAYVVLSEQEKEYAQMLSTGVRCHFLPNATRLRTGESKGNGEIGIGRHVTMIGRICPQKDPLFFAKVAKYVISKNPEIKFQWIGDGDGRLRKNLEKAGVEVKGGKQKKGLQAN